MASIQQLEALLCDGRAIFAKKQEQKEDEQQVTNQKLPETRQKVNKSIVAMLL
jgi:hypothetical protein